MSKTKIDWCDWVFNPVWGCLKNPPCPYCYARRIARRFGKTENERAFIPTWKQKNFDKPFPKKPSRIFVNSMSDIMWWEYLWMEKVLGRIKNHSTHIFQFLTKIPDIYSYYDFPSNCWLGTTITDQYMMDSFANLVFETAWDETNKIFFSFEPLLERIKIYIDPDWVIVGFQTNPFKYIEKKAILDIIEYTKIRKIPLFLKDSIYKAYPELPIIREFPDGR